MRDWAAEQFPDAPTELLVENGSRSTAGNAHGVKVTYLEPNSWHNLAVVTTPYHVPRARRDFKHVLGSDYSIVMHASESPYSPQQERKLRLQELAFGLFDRTVLLGGIKPDEDEKREQRLRAVGFRGANTDPISGGLGLRTLHALYKATLIRR